MEQSQMTFFTLVLSIFFVFNSIGQLPVFLAMLTPYDIAKQKKITIRELVISLGVLILIIGVLVFLLTTPAYVVTGYST